MPTSRRSVTYIVIALAVIVLAAILYKTFPSSNTQTATAGQLDEAIHNFTPDGAVPTDNQYQAGGPRSRATGRP